MTMRASVGSAMAGRGKAQTVRYEFNRQRPDFPMTEVQLKLIGQLKALGVAPPQAEAFVRGHSEAQVQERAQLAELIVTGTRNIKRPTPTGIGIN